MKILEKNIIVEVDKKVAISFNKRYKDFTDVNGDIRSINIKEVKADVADYLLYNRDRFQDKKIFSIVYDYDANLVITIMKKSPEYEIYDIIGFADMTTPEETIEDDEEKAATKEQIKILKENEKIQNAREQEGAKQLKSIIEGLGE